MKCVVFGGNGFIGSHVTDALLAANHTVRVFDRVPEHFRSPLEGVDYITGEFSDPFAIAEALEGMDVVYHLVSTTVPSTSNRDPVTDIETNLVASVQLLEQMVKANMKRIVFLSSGGTVYGNTKTVPVNEDHPKRPICSYAIVKIAIEHYLHMFEELHGLSPIVLRGSNPYGPRQGHRLVQGFIGVALANMLHNEPVNIWGDGSVVRDYLYVADLAHACVLAGESSVTGVYNIGSGEEHSLNDIVKTIDESVGQAPEVVYEASRSFDVQKIVLDISRAKEALNWQPQCPLSEGLHLTWEWMKAFEDTPGS